MSKPAARLGDKDTGHPGAGPTPIITASSDVIINGKGAARKGDKLKKHHKGTRAITRGANSVLINGKPAARVSDTINCGGVIIQGSNNVFIGDTPVLKTPQAMPTQQGSLPSMPPAAPEHRRHQHTPHQPLSHTAAQAPTDHTAAPDTVPATTRVPDYKSVLIRLNINPEKHTSVSDTFILTSTDGNYRATKTLSDDRIPGDDYLDLQYDNLDTRKHFTLACDDGETIYTLFENHPYASLAGLAPPHQDDQDETEST